MRGAVGAADSQELDAVGRHGEGCINLLVVAEWAAGVGATDVATGHVLRIISDAVVDAIVKAIGCDQAANVKAQRICALLRDVGLAVQAVRVCPGVAVDVLRENSEGRFSLWPTIEWGGDWSILTRNSCHCRQLSHSRNYLLVDQSRKRCPNTTRSHCCIQNHSCRRYWRTGQWTLW